MTENTATSNTPGFKSRVSDFANQAASEAVDTAGYVSKGVKMGLGVTAMILTVGGLLLGISKTGYNPVNVFKGN